MAILTDRSGSGKILVSAVGGDIGGGIAKILSEAGLTVVGCDAGRDPASCKYLSSFHLAPLASENERYVEWVLNTCGQNNISTFLPVNEFEIRLIAPLVAQFECRGIQVMVNNSKIVETFLDKLETARFLSRELGVKTPKSVLLSEFDAQIQFPLIIKPRGGRGSKSVFKAVDEWDVDYVRRKFDPCEFVVQEYIGSAAEEYTTALFSNGEKTHSITFRRTLGFGGLSSEVVFVRDPEMESMCERLARVVDLNGSINVQSRKVNGHHVVFEINPRLSSTTPFRKFFGFDDVMWWFDSMYGRGFEYKPIYRAGTGKRVLSEVYFGLE